MGTSAPPAATPNLTRTAASGGVLLRRALVVTGLAGLAIVQPMLDLFGSNPEFFVFKKADDAAIIAFGAIIALGIPLLLVLVELVAWLVRRPMVGAVVHHLIVALLGGSYGLVMARQAVPDSDLTALVALSIGAIGVAAGEARFSVVATVARYLALGPAAFLLLFLGVSPVAKLLWSGEAEAADAVIGEPAPVVVLLLDELPLASLLDADGTIDAERFPGFAALAEGSTWYRNASSNAPSTTYSVPAILSGSLPDLDAIPTSVDHPENLFTLLGGSYDLEVHEEVTALCPTALCDPTDGAADGRAGSAEVPSAAEPRGGLRSMLLDAWVVGRHLALPPTMRSELPALDAAWGGFLGQDVGDVTAPPGGSDPVDAFLAQTPEGRASLAQGEIVADLAASAGPTERPTLWFSHAVLPHQPWEVTERGSRYSLSAELEGMSGGRWGDDERAVLQGYQRHLLQVGYADLQVRRVVESLQASGLWDDAIVVVMADHGVGFGTERLLRKPDEVTVDELYRVPLFIHVPGQASGAIDDRDAMLIDVVPTIIDVLDADVDWRMDGRSLLLVDPPRRSREVRYVQGPSEVGQDLTGLMALARRKEDWLGGPGWPGVYAVGPWADRLGASVEALAPVPMDATWELEQAGLLADLDLEGGFVPILLTGEAPGAPRDGWFLVAVDGTVAGTGFVAADGRFSALVDEGRLRDGPNAVSILVPDGAGGWRSPRLPTVASGTDIQVGDGPGAEVVLADGSRLPIVEVDDRYVTRVDRAVLTDGVLAVGGWALDEQGAVPDRVLLVADGEVLPTSQRRVPRSDLARARGDDVFVSAGFEMALTGVEGLPEALTVLAIYDGVAVRRPVSLKG